MSCPIDIVDRAINNLESEFSRFRRCKFLGQLSRFPFYPRFIRADDGANIRSFGFGFRHR